MVEYKKLSESAGSFACINSGKGFTNYFEEIFEKIKKLYIIKGGPGTGKSSLMRAIAAEGEKRRIRYLPILCSSDPTSLDGLFFPSLGIGIADGTSPHNMEPHLPGAREQIIDMGAFWNEKLLATQKEEIAALAIEKSKSYARAFRFFSAAGAVEEAAHERLASLINREKLERAVENTVRRVLPLVPNGKTQFFPQKALSMVGAVRLSSAENAARKIFSLDPYYGVERFYMEALAKKSAGCHAIISPDPLTLSPDSIYFPAAGVLFRISKKEGMKKEQSISLARFAQIPKEEKRILRSCRKESANLTEFGLSELSAVSKKHFALERIYQNAMDFSGVEAAKKALIFKIFE